jgi:5'-nucleotidase
MKKPTILITNDDGIQAPGLKHLWRSVKDFCNIVIVAPAVEQSGVGLSVTLHSPLHATQFSWEDPNTEAWQITGTPADCVRMALRMLLPSPPDMVLSGINRGTNAGRNILYSGTVGGVIDAAFRGVPGIAFSCEDKQDPNFESFEDQVFPLVKYLLNNPLPSHNFLNVSFPSNHKKEHKGYRLAKQGMSHCIDRLVKRTHPEGKEYYWMGCDIKKYEEDEESDIRLLEEGYITAVPVQVGELTNHDVFHQRKSIFQNHLA